MVQAAATIASVSPDAPSLKAMATVSNAGIRPINTEGTLNWALLAVVVSVSVSFVLC